MINQVYQLTAPKVITVKYDDISFSDKAIIRPEYMAVCHADQRYFLGHRDAKTLKKKLPMALIHECCGKVIFDPEGKWKPGQWVVMVPNIRGKSKGERLLLIGPNGSGKSTLLKMLNGIQLQNEGSVIFGTKVVIGYYDQEMQELSPEKTIFQEIADAYPTLNNTTIRTALAAFLFTGEEVFKQISLLSGGERARVSLAKLMLSEANFLILDEPTNHLDIQSKEILENALNAYEGTVLSVSHDRYFINRVATRILELDNKKLVSYPGNYDDFLFTKEKLAAATLERQEAALQNGDTKVTAMETEAKTSWKDQKALDAKKRKIASDLKKTEEKIACLEEELDAINTKLSDPTVACDPAESLKLSRRHAEAEAELEELYELWESISEEAQTIQ